MYIFNFNRQESPAIPSSGGAENGRQDISESIIKVPELQSDGNTEFDSGCSQELALALPTASKVVALPWQQEALDSGRVSTVEQLPNACQVDGEKNVTKSSSEQQLEQFISNLLKYGVLLSSTIVLVGGILYLIRHGAEPADYQFFRGEPSELCSPRGVVTAVLSGRRRGIIQLGLLLLIATPIARVAFSLLAFLRQREFTYAIVTLFVLAGLIYSFIAHIPHP